MSEWTSDRLYLKDEDANPEPKGLRVVSAVPCLLVDIQCSCKTVWTVSYPIGTRTGVTLDEINALPKGAPRIAVFKAPKHDCEHSEVSLIVGILPERN